MKCACSKLGTLKHFRSLLLKSSCLLFAYLLACVRREKGKNKTGCEQDTPVPLLLGAVNEIRFKVEKEWKFFAKSRVFSFVSTITSSRTFYLRYFIFRYISLCRAASYSLARDYLKNRVTCLCAHTNCKNSTIRRNNSRRGHTRYPLRHDRTSCSRYEKKRHIIHVST